MLVVGSFEPDPFLKISLSVLRKPLSHGTIGLAMRHTWKIVPLALAMFAGAFLAWWIFSFWDLLGSMAREAWMLSLGFKTSTLSVVGVGAILLISLAIKGCREDRKAMRAHLVKHLLESLIPAVRGTYH